MFFSSLVHSLWYKINYNQKLQTCCVNSQYVYEAKLTWLLIKAWNLWLLITDVDRKENKTVCHLSSL